MTDPLVAALECDAVAIAVEVVDLMEQRHPDLFTRYGETGRVRCVEDTEFHIRHLAAAVDSNDQDEFRRYRRWLTDLLEPRGVPAEDIDANLSTLGEVLGARYGRSAAKARSFLADRQS